MRTCPRRHFHRGLRHRHRVARDERWPGRVGTAGCAGASGAEPRRPARRLGCSGPGGHGAEPEDQRHRSAGLGRAGGTRLAAYLIASARSGAGPRPPLVGNRVGMREGGLEDPGAGGGPSGRPESRRTRMQVPPPTPAPGRCPPRDRAPSRSLQSPRPLQGGQALSAPTLDGLSQQHRPLCPSVSMGVECVPG